MELDIEVAKLRMLKADHQSQHYRLEDSLLKTFPQQITAISERIAGIEIDIAAYAKEKEKCAEIVMINGAASASSKFAGMTINGKHYAEKEPAAKALLESCKGVTDKADKPIGEYMGFKLSIRFDTFSKQFSVLLRGQMTYSVELGTDAFGNITRINNALDKLPERLEGQKSQLENVAKQQDAAREELAKPFSLESELQEKEARLALLNADLNIDGDGGLDVTNDTENRGDSDGNDEQDEADYGEDEPEYGEQKVSCAVVNPAVAGNFSRQSERTGTYGKARPNFLESLKNLESKKQPTVPGSAKSSEHEI